MDASREEINPKFLSFAISRGCVNCLILASPACSSHRGLEGNQSSPPAGLAQFHLRLSPRDTVSPPICGFIYMTPTVDVPRYWRKSLKAGHVESGWDRLITNMKRKSNTNAFIWIRTGNGEILNVWIFVTKVAPHPPSLQHPEFPRHHLFFL